MNQLSVFYEHIADAAAQTGLPLSEICRRVKAFGFDLVEMDANRLLGAEETILPMLREAGLGVNCIYHFFDLGIGAAHLTADRAEAEKIVQLCVRADCKKLLVVAGFLTPAEMERGSAAYTLRRSRMAQGVQALVDIAKAHGITVVMEDFDSDTAPFSTAEELVWFMENVQGLRCGFDTGNFLYSEEDAAAALPALLPHISGVHCKDRSLRANDGVSKATVTGRLMYPVAVGDGELDIAGLMRAVLEAGYTGAFTAEHFDSKHQLRDMERSAVFMRTVLEAFYEKA